MIWDFNEPQVTIADGNIDAVCFRGLEEERTTDDSPPVKYDWSYSAGGFCCGIKYVGNFSSQPEIWAVWFTHE